MELQEFQEKWMSDAAFGKNPSKFPDYAKDLQKVSSKNKVKIIAAILEKNEAGIQSAEQNFFFFLLEKEPDLRSKNQEKTLFTLLRLIENPEVEKEDIERIFSSSWIKTTDISSLPIPYQWLYSFLNFPKQYAALFIKALEEQKSFSKWRKIIVPTFSSSQSILSVKEAILEALSHWPTEGRSGYALLCQLKSLDAVKKFENDSVIQDALDNVEGKCDFGSISKVQEMIKERR